MPKRPPPPPPPPEEEPPVLVETVFEIAVSGDDGFVTVNDTVYPPSEAGRFPWSEGDTDAAERSFSGGVYIVGVGLMRFDTSTLPAGPIVEARLRLHLLGISGWAEGHPDIRTLQIEWYDPGTIDVADYTVTAASDAFADVDVRVFPMDNDFLLVDAEANINRSGYTGFRLHISGDVPDDVHVVSWASFDHADDDGPRLIVVTEDAEHITATKTARTSGRG